MGRRINIILCVALMLTAGMAEGQETVFSPVAQKGAMAGKINASNAGIQSLQCHFVQEKELSFLEEKAFSSGKFYYQKENKIRWEYENPYAYVIIMNGSMVRIVDEGKSNTLDASSNRMFNSINSVMTGIIDGSVINREDQFKSEFLENDRMVRIILKPLIPGMKEFISSIELELTKKDYTVETLKIIENTGDYTLIRFNDKQFNAEIPTHTFDIR